MTQQKGQSTPCPPICFHWTANGGRCCAPNVVVASKIWRNLCWNCQSRRRISSPPSGATARLRQRTEWARAQGFEAFLPFWLSWLHSVLLVLLASYTYFSPFYSTAQRAIVSRNTAPWQYFMHFHFMVSWRYGSGSSNMCCQCECLQSWVVVPPPRSVVT